MIVEFSVKNFRSIKELQTISFATTGLKSAEKHSEIDSNNIATEGDMRLFKTLGIYGANASGKSNIIKALDYFIATITREPSSESNMNLLADPFLYQPSSQETESFFQIVLLVNGIKYRYGLTIKKNAISNGGMSYSQEIITNEWLYGRKHKKMVPLFQRDGMQLIKNTLVNKNVIPKDIPYEHTLFLTHSAAFDKRGECHAIRKYFTEATTSNFKISHEKFRFLSMAYISDESFYSHYNKEDFINFLSIFGLSYSDITIEQDESLTKYITRPFPQAKVFLHKQYKDNKNKTVRVSLNLRDNESAGTQKLFDLAGLLRLIFRSNESSLIILDEIDGNFHPSLLIKLIGLFNNPAINKSKSQLLFTSHDTNLMSPAIMRRDQFFFTEKNEDESTKLYSLADLKGIRNDADFAKQYLAGYYGAVPVLSNFMSTTVEDE